ncbi:hypothetical protein SCUCBS95973_000713 [Sporothrix curviconia]|uniref:Zn(2)-C6 fungal-type domain-containing protein n=1 Tax=Sporothrix curviconia TaxID=1260050 RepID=A0ABP0ASI9_9PEZI
MEPTRLPAPVARQSHSCARCAQRKVKCMSCGACVRHGLECLFPAPAPRSRRRPTVDTKALTDRLRRYETWFRQRGFDPDNLPQLPPSSSDSGPSETPRIEPEVADNNQALSFAGGERPPRKAFASKYIDIQDDLHSLGDGSSTADVAGPDGTSETVQPEGPLFLLTGHWPSRPPSSSRTRPAHPPPDTIRKLWQVYRDHADPLTKLLHVPTVQQSVDRAMQDGDGMARLLLSRANEALLFAVYAADVMSLSEDACRETLGEQRSVLLPRYLAAAGAALARAGLLGASDMATLQALVVYLLAMRDCCAPRAVWALTGVAMRIAACMGLDRKASAGQPSSGSGLMSAFDLRMHDFRAAELCGRPKFEGLAEMADMAEVAGSTMAGLPRPTQWPANVNDADLSPRDVDGAGIMATDAVFVAVKCELLRFTAARLARLRTRTQTSSKQPENLWALYNGDMPGDGGSGLQALETRLETRYLRYCDPSRPLHLMATLMGRCAVNILRL